MSKFRVFVQFLGQTQRHGRDTGVDLMFAEPATAADFTQWFEPHALKHAVELVSVEDRPATQTLEVCLRLPERADRHLRHEVLHALSEYEQEHDLAVVTNPVFVWGDDEPDE